MQEIHIALIQHKAVPNSPRENLSLAVSYMCQAHRMGADMALFPEMWSNGYAPPFEGAFDNPFDPNYEKERKQWLNEAVSADSGYISVLKDAAKELRMGVAATYLAKTAGKPQNAAAVIGRTGDILLEYAKVHTCDFSLEALLQSGSAFGTCLFDGIRIGVMICFDREFPESARALMLQGAELILVPNACGMDPARLNQLSARAFENMTGIAMANYPAAGWGCSCAFSPIVYDKNGVWRENTIIKTDDVSEQIVMAVFDIEEIRAFRQTEPWGNAFRKPIAYGCLIQEHGGKGR